jgi:hypothetical protein
MNLLRSRWSTMCAAVSLGCLFACPAPARAQAFVELGGGWNAPTSVSSGGSNFRASIGWQVEPSFRWRIDAFTNQFDAKTSIAYPCPSFGCSPGLLAPPERVNGLTANGLVSVDQRGVFYLIGGAGLYDVEQQTTELHFGVSAGAGIAVPVAPHVRAVVEARWHSLLGATAGPTWLVPITVGLRFF